MLQERSRSFPERRAWSASEPRAGQYSSSPAGWQASPASFAGQQTPPASFAGQQTPPTPASATQVRSLRSSQPGAPVGLQMSHTSTIEAEWCRRQEMLQMSPSFADSPCRRCLTAPVSHRCLQCKWPAGLKGAAQPSLRTLCSRVPTLRKEFSLVCLMRCTCAV